MDCLPHPHPPLTALIIITCPGGEARGRDCDNSLAWDTAGSCQGPSPPLQREQDNAGQHRPGPLEAILSQKSLLSSSERSVCSRWHLGDPRGGRNQKNWNARSAEEKNEASRGSYDTAVKLQLLRGMGGSPGLGMHTSADFQAAVQLWGPGSDFSSALSSSVGFLMTSWSRHQPGKEIKKRTGNTINCCLSLLSAVCLLKSRSTVTELSCDFYSCRELHVKSCPLPMSLEWWAGNLWVWQKCSGCDRSVCGNQQLELPQPGLAGGLCRAVHDELFFSGSHGMTLPPAWRVVLTKKRSSIKAPNNSNVE